MAQHSGSPLELRDEGLSGYRQYLDGRAVHTGTVLEVLTDEGWKAGRYEWSCIPPEQAFLILVIYRFFGPFFFESCHLQPRIDCALEVVRFTVIYSFDPCGSGSLIIHQGTKRPMAVFVSPLNGRAKSSSSVGLHDAGAETGARLAPVCKPPGGPRFLPGTPRQRRDWPRST